MNNFYIYIHTRPDNGAVFYVGKGKGKRAFNLNRNPHWAAIYKKYGREVCIVTDNLSENEALNKEKELISHFKSLGADLVNKTDGGEGISGFSHSPNTKLKISNSLQGHKVSEKTKTTLSKALKGKKIHTEESRIKISKAQRGKKKPDSMRIKLSNSTKGKMRAHFTPDFFQKIQRLAADAVRGTKQTIKVCPHCGKQGGVAPMKRWHFENCRQRSLSYAI